MLCHAFPWETDSSLQEFHRAVADEVAEAMRGARDVAFAPGRGPGAFREHGRGPEAGGGPSSGAPLSAGRVLLPPIPQDPATNPRGIEAIVKLRGLPWGADPRAVTDWINAAVQNKEAFLSQRVRSSSQCSIARLC
jgi:hypothetical protein